MWNLAVTNIGGIRSGSTTIEEGLNVIQASNFRGKSSLVAACKTALGATGQYDNHPLTEGAEEGEVTIETEADEYNVMLKRASSGTVNRTGTPYVTDETDQVCIRLFACPDEDNPIRKAVRNGNDLTDLLQAPLNIEDIDAQIADLKSEKSEVEQRMSKAKQAGEELPAVQETVTRLETELEELRDRSEELAEEETNKERIEEISGEISTKSGNLANITDDISRIEREIERKEDRASQKETEVEDLDVPDEPDGPQEVDALQDQIDALDRQIDLVEDIYRANQNAIDAGAVDVIADVHRSIAGDEVECWVCGHGATKEDIEEHIAQLQTTTTELQQEKSEIEVELEEIESRQRERRRARQKRERLESEVQQLRADIDEKRGILEDKRERKEELEAEITSLRDRLESAEDEYNEELTDVKAEIRTTETKLHSERENLEELERQYSEVKKLESERDKIRTDLNDLRNRKKNTQEGLKERFNVIIADIIDEFQPGFSSARLVLKTDENGEVEAIDLEIARDIDSKGQRTSVDTLSEGEVELIGLVVTLAGYHAFDVGSLVPCILIDGISQLAAEHLRSVANYLDDTSEVLVTTAYPEAGDFDGHVIDPDEWDVVSDEPATAT